MIPIAQTDAGILRGEVVPRYRPVLKVVRKGVVWDLVVIIAQRRYKAQLIGSIGIEDERSETAVSVRRIVDHFRNGRL